VIDGANEVFPPLLDRTRFAARLFAVRLFAVNPVQVRLKIAIRAGHFSHFDGE
jgi:hypothetical protein